PALLAIQEAGREASRELRATLEALRDDDTSPPHGLDHIPQLVERFQGTGLETTLTIGGHPHPVPAAVSRTAYRIVQESLTNVARHAAATTARVLIDYRPDALALRVDDDGTAVSPCAPMLGPGLGLLGMRERVTALGGRLHTGPRSSGGFTVRAELPTNGASRSGLSWSMTSRSSAAVSVRCSTSRTTSRWWPRPPTARNAWRSSGSCCPMSLSSTSRCPSWTASKRPGASPRTR